MPSSFDEWRTLVRERIVKYGEMLENRETGREIHESRNGLREEDYVRPGISVEIPLFWGTF